MNLKKSRTATDRPHPMWVDWVLLALAVAVIFLGVGYVLYRRRAAVPTVEIRYTVCVLSVDTAFLDEGESWLKLIPIGSAVTTANGTASLGSVTAVSARPHTIAAVEGEEVVFVELSDRVDLLVTVRATAIAKDGDGLRVRDIRIAAGEKGDFRLGGFLASGADVVSVTRRET